MPHIVFFIYLSSLVCGAAAIGVCVVIFTRYRKPSLKYFIFLIVTIIYFPLQLIDFLINRFPWLIVFSFLNNLIQPCYFLVTSVLFIVFAVRYFNEPPYRALGRLTYRILSVINHEKDCARR
jgi:hypothetical protein